jgi:purine-cytosine permease-like protein
METIITLLLIGYTIGFVIIAYFGIVGTNEVIDYHNNKKGK